MLSPTYGERMVGCEGHRAAREWWIACVQELGLAPYHGAFERPYRREDQSLVNVPARLPGATEERPHVLLAAHHDTCGRQPGADDNAAAIAILLAMVPVLRARGVLERDVILAFLDAQEPPYSLGPAMGSTYFYCTQRKAPTHCAIVMDLCGHTVPLPGHGDLSFVTGMESDPGLATVVRATCEARPDTHLGRLTSDPTVEPSPSSPRRRPLAPREGRHVDADRAQDTRRS